MKKITILIDNLEIGGTATILNEYLKMEPFVSNKVEVFSYFKPREFEAVEGVKYNWVFNLYSYKYLNIIIPLIFNFTSLSKLLSKKLIKNNPDIVICFSEYTGLTRLLHAFKGKNICWVHSGAKNFDHTYKNLFNFEKYLNSYDEIICVSNDVKDELLEKYNIVSNIRVILNPVDEKKIIEKSKSKDVILAGKNVVIVGKVTFEKGMDRLLELATANCKLNFHVIGVGEYTSKLETLSNVKCYGKLKNPYPYIAKSDCLLILSRLEGLPTTAIEASILGTAVLSVPIQGINDISKKYENLKIMEYDMKNFSNYLNNTTFPNEKIIWNEKINIDVLPELFK